jgi:Zn finger protein HypA/HybF involved in hydrogenase expression
MSARKGSVPPNKITWEKFLEKARSTHGLKYEYKEPEKWFGMANTKVEILCKEHGWFIQSARVHADWGQGCPKCAGKGFTLEEQIQRAVGIHGDKYDYSLVTLADIKGAFTKVKIICKKHGKVFEQAWSSHLSGYGCPICGHEVTGQANKVRLSLGLQGLIRKAQRIHGSRFDYSVSSGTSFWEVSSFKCVKHSKIFERSWGDHFRLLSGGCPVCESLGKITKEEWVSRFLVSHEVLYDYTLLPDEIKGSDRVQIRCPEGHLFVQVVSYHANGEGCPVCGGKLPLGLEGFIARSKETHGDRYDYSKVVWKNVHEKVEIVCPKHGSFWQVPYSHYYNGCSCPDCAREEWQSKGEKYLGDWLTSHGFNVVPMYRGHGLKFPWGKKPFELDLYLPDQKVAFEYDSPMFHSVVDTSLSEAKPQNYHSEKTRLCAEAGIRLYHIWEDIPFEVMDGILSAKFGFGERYAARKCRVGFLSNKEAQDFYGQSHRQRQSSTGLFHIALFRGDEVLACMQWRKWKEGKVELARYAGKPGVQVIGGMSRLLKHSIPLLVSAGFKRVVSFCDIDLSPVWQDTMYAKTGFTFEGNVGSQLWYYVSVDMGKFPIGFYNRRNFQKQLLCKYWPENFKGQDISSGKPLYVVTPEGEELKYGEVREIDICSWHGVYACYNAGNWKFSLSLER